MAPLGAFEAGTLAEHVGAPRAVAAGALVCFIAVALAAWRAPELRHT
jgi:fumarate reductase subunit D